MKFEKGFNPGQNNIYNEVNFGPNSQYLPNVTELTIVNGSASEDKGKTVPRKDKEEEDNIDTFPIRTEILNYVSCVRPFLKDEWKQSYMKLWEGIIDLDVIAKQVYKSGKQQKTNFNRKLVCMIIHYLDRKNFYKGEYNVSEMTRALEGDDQHSIRTTALCFYPDEETCTALDDYIEDFKL